jgi:hypothetical protein
VSPETVGEKVVRAIETAEFCVFCDGADSREMLETRCRDMLAAMDRQFPEGTDD